MLVLICSTPDNSLGEDLKDPGVYSNSRGPVINSAREKAFHDEEETRRDIESYVLKWTNTERKKLQLSLLKTSATLGRLAQSHSRNQARAGLMAHDSHKFPEGWGTFEERMKKLQIVPPVIFGENVFWSSSGAPLGASERNDYARKMVQAWMTSEDHRKNILHVKFSRMGLGIFNGFVTQLFASQDPVK